MELDAVGGKVPAGYGTFNGGNVDNTHSPSIKESSIAIYPDLKSERLGVTHEPVLDPKGANPLLQNGVSTTTGLPNGTGPRDIVNEQNNRMSSNGFDNPVYESSSSLNEHEKIPSYAHSYQNSGGASQTSYQGNRLTLSGDVSGAEEAGEVRQRLCSPVDDREVEVDVKVQNASAPSEDVLLRSQSTVTFCTDRTELIEVSDDYRGHLGTSVTSSRPRSKSVTQSIREFVHELAPDDGTKKKKSVFTHIKVFILFVATLISVGIFAIHPEKSALGHQLSVAQWQTHELNVTGVNEHFCIVNLYTQASYLLKRPGPYTQNVTYRITNPSTGNTERVTYVIANHTDLTTIAESVYDFRFDFCREHISANDPLTLTVTSTTQYSVPVTVSFISNSPEVYNEVIYAAIILLSVYVLIIFELVHRTLAAMIGALAALAVLASLNVKPSLEEVLEWLDYDTLALLFGMMLIVGIFCESGFFDWIAITSYKLTKGRLWPLITLLCVFCAVVSAFLDNVTTILLLTPVTIRLCEVLGVDPKHILILLVLFSNVGGTATAIGDPPNVIIISSGDLIEASKGQINFTTFTLHMFIGSIFTTVVLYGFTRFMYRNKELLKCVDPPDIAELKVEINVWRQARNKMVVTGREEEMVKNLLLQKIQMLEELMLQKEEKYKTTGVREFEVQLEELEKKYGIRDKQLLIKSSIVIVAVIVCFFMHSFVPSIHLTIGWIAILGAISLLVLTDYADMESIFDRVEWATLLFFAALFVLMEALTQLGLINWIAELCISMIKAIDEEARLVAAITIILWISALASSFIDNIPFTTAMVPVVIQLTQDKELSLPLSPLIFALAFGACLGGNGTLIGASANVVCAGLAEKHGHPFSFWDFFKAGFPCMLVTVVIANIYLIICHVLFSWHDI